MSGDKNNIFSEDEKDILQEIMNIAFGNATADLAEIIDIYVVLSVPVIKIINIGDLPNYIMETIDSSEEMSIVDQKFWGDLNGSGFLVFPNNTGRNLIEILNDSDDEKDMFNSKPIATLEKEVLMEVGNILIGACVGKICELLSTFVTYSPPQVIGGNTNDYKDFIKSFDPSQTAIILKTLFKFEEKDVNGLLLLLTNEDSIEWMKKALNEFMESYE